MRVLIACEFSGVVRDAFLAQGHDAYSCDLLLSTSERERESRHYVDDARNLLDLGWDLLIAHPPCTYFANSSVQWLTRTPPHPTPRRLYGTARWNALRESGDLFRTFLHAPIARIAVENPIPHNHAMAEIGRCYDQIIQPYEHGHPESKQTCLWLKNLPLLQPSHLLPPPYKQSCFEAAPGPDRWAIRSLTFQGIAEAMADQWGRLPIIANTPYDLLEMAGFDTTK